MKWHKKTKNKQNVKVIRKLQSKFVIVTMLILTLVLGAILGTVNIWMKQVSSGRTQQLLNNMLEHNGAYQAVVNSEGTFFLFHNRVFDSGALRNAFSLRYIEDEGSIEILSPYPLHFTKEELSHMIAEIVIEQEPKGNYEGIRYLLKKTERGFLGAFVDCRIDDNNAIRMLTMSIIVFVVSLLLAMILSLIMSRWSIKPVKTAFIKQKQFVGDASHELKTPIAVIGTNLSVLETEIGKNKWCGYIQSEIDRMSDLVKDLLFLAKYEDNNQLYEFKEFNISKAITGAVLPFESLAFEKGRVLEYQIEDNLIFKGDEKRIKQLAIIFLDNAVKHSDKTDLEEIPHIRLTLRQAGSKIELSVFNTGMGLDTAERKKVFERFYRSDSSRNRETGGSGLGLAIASTIAQAHKSKINIESKVGEWICFSVFF